MDALLRSKGTKSTLNLEIMNEVIVKQFSLQKAARKKMCCILVILVVVAGALGLIIWLSVRHNN